MEALTIVTWLWGDKYGQSYVDKLARGLERHLHQPYRFLQVSPDPSDVLLKQPGCFVRLRMFDPQWQREQQIEGRLVCLDLDVVITGELDQLFDRNESFVILQGANSTNPCPYNGSLMMLRTREHADVWQDFSLAAAYRTRFYKYPDDQGWLWHKLPLAAGWTAGAKSGVWSFRKRGWPHDDTLPQGARLVCFPGAADPSHFQGLPWMRKHWQ